MTNEEKQSINNLKKYIEEDFAFREPLKNYSDFDKFCYNHCKDIDTVLNLLEKNKKEIKELKAKHYFISGLRNGKSLLKQNVERAAEFERLKKENEELKKYEQYYKEQNEVNTKFVPKSKIQDKIDELEKEYQNVEEKYYLSQYISMREYEILQKNQGYIKVLQKLLESEGKI